MMRSPSPACLLLAALAAACGPANARPDQPPPRPAPPVYVQPVETRTVLDRIRTVGQLEADEAVVLRSEIKGVVTTVSVDDGDRVVAGQTLFTLDDARARAALAEAEAQVEEIQANRAKAVDDLEQDRALRAQGILDAKRLRAAQSTYNALQAALVASEARVQQLRIDLADTVIQAPLDGVIGERRVYRGDYVEDGDALLEILRIDPLDLRFTVSEGRLAGVRHGARVDFIVAGFADEVFHGEIEYIAPEADMASRNVAVKARVLNPDHRLLPGFFVKLQVISEERPNAVVIPESAVVLEGSQVYAYVLQSETVERRVVVLGLRTDDDYYEIHEGIAAGETIVVRGQYGLADGATVRVVERRGADAD